MNTFHQVVIPIGIEEGYGTSPLEPLNVQLPIKGYDRFGRIRVSQPEFIFESSLVYDSQPTSWGFLNDSYGSGVYLPNESSYELSVTTQADAYAIRQTHRYFTYFPGVGYLMMFTGVLGPKKTNLVSRIGYFDAYDGIFFENNDGETYITLRTSTSGSSQDNQIAQANWNLDPMDGTGPSKLVLDTTKTQIFAFDFSWLGVGGVRCSVIIGQKVINVHEFVETNIIDKVYMKTPNLPIRYEIRNLGTTASSSSMKQICSVILKEGLGSLTGRSRSADNGITKRAISTTALPVLSIRLKEEYKRSKISLNNFSIYVPENVDVLVKLIYNGTLTNANFADNSDISQKDVSATAISGGSVIFSQYIKNTNQSSALSINVPETKEIIGARADGTRDVLSVVVQTISSTATCAVAVNFLEEA